MGPFVKKKIRVKITPKPNIFEFVFINNYQIVYNVYLYPIVTYDLFNVTQVSKSYHVLSLLYQLQIKIISCVHHVYARQAIPRLSATAGHAHIERREQREHFCCGRQQT